VVQDDVLMQVMQQSLCLGMTRLSTAVRSRLVTNQQRLHAPRNVAKSSIWLAFTDVINSGYLDKLFPNKNVAAVLRVQLILRYVFMPKFH